MPTSGPRRPGPPGRTTRVRWPVPGAALAALAAVFVVALAGPAAGTGTAGAQGTADAAGVTNLAGTGTPGSGGGAGPARRAQLDGPTGIALDAAGDLFIADTGNCAVREVVAHRGTAFGHRVRAGTIVTLAGGPCRTRPAAPVALAVDAAGNLYVDWGTANEITVLAAHDTTLFGVPVTAGRQVRVAGTGAAGYSGDRGPARRARLDDPGGLAVDRAGDLLIADTANCRLRLVAAARGTRFGIAVRRGRIYTVAGDGVCGSAGDGGPARAAQLWDPGAVAVGPSGDVLVADQGNRSIRVLTAGPGTFYGVALSADDLGTVAGEGSYGPYLIDGLPALGQTAELNFPSGIAVDARGDLYIADGAMHAIRLLPAAPMTLHGVTAQADDLYTVAGAVSVGPGHRQTAWVQTRLRQPTGLALLPNGALAYSDAEADIVAELPPGT